MKSPSDLRSYRYITLDNKLSALLIHDESTNKSGCALDVHVGASLDPKDRNGLAHFLEHMLFWGTEKYPETTHYSKFIKSHGGRKNASTSLSETNYMFEIQNDSFVEAVDIFS